MSAKQLGEREQDREEGRERENNDNNNNKGFLVAQNETEISG